MYVQNRRSVSPRIRSVEALGWTSTTVCVAFHDGGESAAVCVHWFLFPSGENWCWKVRNAASSFRKILPKSIEDIWLIFPFQKWTPILWRRTPPRQAFHLPNRGDRGTCARNHSCWPTSDYQRGCRGSSNSIRYVPENSKWRFSNETVTPKFVTRLLTAEQKDDRVSNCTDLRDRAQNDPKFVSSVITGDECWVYGYDPETKEMSSQWSTSSSPRPKKARQVRSNIKSMLIAFFDTDRLVHHEFVPTGQTVNKEFNKTSLQRFRDAVHRHRPEKWRSGNWILHHDNVHAHWAVTTNEFLAKHNIPSLPQPTYSPDLASCDFFLFPQQRKTMKRRRFD